MIELSGMFEEELILLLNWLAGRKRHVAFEGAQVVSEGGIGRIRNPLPDGPVVQGRRIATLGSPYSVPRIDLGNSCCPHHVSGQIETGAEDIVFEGVPVVMVGDTGRHWPGCGTAQVFVAEGWQKMLVPRAQWDFSRIGRSAGFTFTADTKPEEALRATFALGLRPVDDSET
ncbi:hypothetical protein [Vannielia litorea]|uniref:Uncharacterized protein n=1 Tax=Vannielia litorea TaxID=1217970 RepID=A0A1N6GDF7_9RHOB|nr:hypothetical protein [Vannielia litorea]SIO05531.1 hypothetical protein SAMN05444002_2394 [Vannielia litorea]